METHAGNGTALAVAQHRPLARAIEFGADQRKMIRDSFASGASDSEFAVLMEVAKARNLNPLLRQIHFVKRWDSQKRCEVWSTQISIDGLRAVAERTGVYDGQSEPAFEYAQGSDARQPLKCTVHVYRKDWSSGRSAVGVAFFSEYAQSKKDGTLTSFWASKPHIMLAKCAEALAIRKAFPEDTSGLYVAEEMGQEPAIEGEAREVKVTVEPPPAPQLPPPAPAPERKVPIAAVGKLWTRCKREFGEKNAADRLKAAASEVWGDAAKPSNEWSIFDAQAVEAVLFPVNDVP
jgi:phage recombination protein Bet